MPIVIGLLTIVAGVLTTVQSGSNAALDEALGQPILVALVVMAANLAVCPATIPVPGLSWPAPERFAGTPWWARIGGVFGALSVLSAVLFAERLGAALFTGLVVTASAVTSIALDHLGWVGFERHAPGSGGSPGAPDDRRADPGVADLAAAWPTGSDARPSPPLPPPDDRHPGLGSGIRWFGRVSSRQVAPGRAAGSRGVTWAGRDFDGMPRTRPLPRASA